MALFKLVYADKKAGDTKRCLYASTTGIPADTDIKVSYSPDFTYGEGTGEKCYIYNAPVDGKPGFKVSSSRTQIPADADVQTVAYSNGVNILTGEAFTPPVASVAAPEVKAAKPAKTTKTTKKEVKTEE